jgi:hypothetical protein
VADTSATPGTVEFTDVDAPAFITEISDASGTGAYYFEFVELYCAGS